MVSVRDFKEKVRQVLYVVGFRDATKAEAYVVIFAIILALINRFLLGENSLAYIPSVLLMLFPIVKRAIERYRLDKSVRELLLEEQFPIIMIIGSAILSFLYPYSIPLVALYAYLSEDYTQYLQVELVVVKRKAKLLILPLKRRDYIFIVGLPAFNALIVYIVTGVPLVVIYPLIAYLMVLYSSIVLPEEYRSEEAEREVVISGAHVLRRIFYAIYFRQSLKRLGKEAGYVGESYHTFVKSWARLFIYISYLSVVISPTFFLIKKSVVLAVFPLLLMLTVLFLPYLILVVKKQQRASLIEKNILFILTYIASMFSVNESFTNAMENLRRMPSLAKLFGLYNESRLYMNIYAVKRNESEAMDEYADSVPSDFYRDTIRTMRDYLENEGTGATFRMLVNRLREYTGRYADKVRMTFENIGSNLMSVVILLQTSLPLFVGMRRPQMLPFIILFVALISASAMYGIATMTLPVLPSEFPNFKQRLRKASIVFIVVSTALFFLTSSVLEKKNLIVLLLPLAPALHLAVYYASYEDIKLNNLILNKLSDILMLFSSSLGRHGSTEKAMMELSENVGFGKDLARVFRKIANIVAYANLELLEYRGTYWYKFLLFATTLSARYGTAPRQLYLTISSFAQELKRFLLYTLKMFAINLLIMSAIGLVITTMEASIISSLAISVGKASEVAGSASQQVMASLASLPYLSQEEYEKFIFYTYVALLILATLDGVVLGKIFSQTVRDGRFTLILYLFQLVVIFIAKTTNFGMGGWLK